MNKLAEAPSTSVAHDNSVPVSPWGRFQVDKHEFILETPFSPKPWKNILWNEHYNAQPTQASGGISYRRDKDGRIILLNWTGEKYIYLKNLNTGEIWSPSIAPISNKAYDKYQHTIGLFYSTTDITQCQLKLRLTQSVDHKLAREYFELELTSLSDRPQEWRIYFFSDIDLKAKANKFSPADRYSAQWTDDRRRAVITNTIDPQKDHSAFLECSQPLNGVAFERTDFTGVYGSLARPDAVLEDWPQKNSPIERATLAGYVDYELLPNATHRSFFTLGLADFSDQDLTQIDKTTAENIAASKHAQSQRIETTYSTLGVETPDAEFDLFTNTWIKHQLQYCAAWNRGWEKGFRDSNQDAWAYTLLNPAQSKQMIYDCLPYQYADGRTVRKWGPVDRDAYNDGGAWLIFATHAYLAETGDFEALDHYAPFFESDESGTLYEHLHRCVEYLWKNRGDRGLCLMPYGDWNDRLTGIGKGGKGQSVWTTMALVESLRQMTSIAKKIGRLEDVKLYSSRTTELVELVRTNAWNGQWYSRAFTDDGSPVGAPECTYGSIYLLPQAWSIIAGIATEEQYPAIIEAVEKHLQLVHGYRLLAPPYQGYDRSIGHLSATQPGRLENGGNYCHGTMFMTYALSMANQRSKAMQALKSIFPTNPENPPAVSRQEPYSLTNSYAAPEAGDTSGQSYFSWRTGAAGWALRAAIEGIMGVVATLDGLKVAGTLPVASWNQASLIRTFNGKKLKIEWIKTGTTSRSLNGLSIGEQPIPADQLNQGENELRISF